MSEPTKGTPKKEIIHVRLHIGVQFGADTWTTINKGDKGVEEIDLGDHGLWVSFRPKNTVLGSDSRTILIPWAMVSFAACGPKPKGAPF